MNLVPIVVSQEGRGERSYDIFSRLLRDRIIMVEGEVSDEMAALVTSQLLFLASEDEEKDIYMYITSPGGSILAGMGILNTMQHIKPDVATIAVGYTASMGTILLAGGAKGKRSALKDSEIMIHQASGGAKGTTADMEISITHQKKLENKLFNYLSEWSGKSLAQVKKDCNRDKWMDAAEAKEYGLIDNILE